MRLPVSPPSRRDPTIALINIVFLMLIFFLISSTLARPLDSDLELIRVADLVGREPPDALVLTVDGVLTFRGAVTTPDSFMNSTTDRAVRIVPDRNVPAKKLVQVTGELRLAGATSVFVVAERIAP